jgi:hypothetical protein
MYLYSYLNRYNAQELPLCNLEGHFCKIKSLIGPLEISETQHTHTDISLARTRWTYHPPAGFLNKMTGRASAGDGHLDAPWQSNCGNRVPRGSTHWHTASRAVLQEPSSRRAFGHLFPPSRPHWPAIGTRHDGCTWSIVTISRHTARWKVDPVPNRLSTISLNTCGEGMYRSEFYWPQHKLKLQAPADSSRNVPQVANV